MTPQMVVFGLFLLCLFAFVAALASFQGLVLWTGDHMIAAAVIAAIAACVAVAVAVTRSSGRLWAFILAAAIILFWSLAIFQLSGETQIVAFVVAGIVLFVGIAVAIADYLMMLWPPTRGPS